MRLLHNTMLTCKPAVGRLPADDDIYGKRRKLHAVVSTLNCCSLCALFMP